MKGRHGNLAITIFLTQCDILPIPPPPPPLSLWKIQVMSLKNKTKWLSYPSCRLDQFNDYLSKTKTELLFHTVSSALMKKKNKWMATKPFHEVCLGNILLFPWFNNKNKQTNKNSNRGIPRFLTSIFYHNRSISRFLISISTLDIIPCDSVSFLAV